MDKDTDIAKEICKNNAGIAIENGKSEQLKDWLLSIVNEEIQLSEMNENVQKIIYERTTVRKIC